ncbi:MAG: DsbA family oxidoreductase [Streptosporangiales bacterium]|jgi:predicted DsbA family dithiol-disulfide isomerase|nr:DsbA family oxidoreductase [Streptosporangiales bacterium]
MRVDIWSDVVCPWCYVGKARFEKALANFAHRDKVEVVFRSFELDPDRPAGERETVLGMLSQKYGMPPEQARQAEDRVSGLARAEGLDYSADRPVGNTFGLHRVLHLARDKGVQHDLLAAVYQAYFGEGEQIFDAPVITAIAEKAGLASGDIQPVLDDDSRYAGDVRADESEARRLGITGVPFFVFDMTLGVSGAQATETFTQALEQAWSQAAG